MHSTRSTPDVSIIVPTYNRAHVLPRTLRSALRQTFDSSEVVVIDDGSRDGTRQVVSELVEAWNLGQRLRYLELDRNRGANAARNEGIRQAKGRYLAFLDSDDLWHPEKLRRQVDAADRVATRDVQVLSYTGRIRVDAAGRILARQLPGNARRMRRHLWRVNTIGPLSSVLVSTDVAKRVGGFDEALPACQDWDFFLRVAPHSSFVGLPEPLLAYLDAGPDRISEAPLRRFRGHAAVYRRHIRGQVERRDQYRFWRNVAEDLDDLGHSDWARRFLSYQELLRGEWRRAARIFRGRGSLGLREARYLQYQQRLDTAESANEESQWLEAFMSTHEPTAKKESIS